MIIGADVEGVAQLLHVLCSECAAIDAASIR
jgi:hypothetical protein